MRFVDFATLVLIIAAAIQVGVQGAFGVDAAGAIFGTGERIVFILMGVSGVWQFFRQRFR
jgi:uncharacterized membrane protein YuzA (DUF378 family)